MSKVEKLAKVSALVEFRKKYMIEEMEANLQVCKEIRDNSESKDKDRIEASKLISRMMHGLQPDKTATAKATAKQVQVQQALTKAEDKKLEELLNGKHSIPENPV